MVFGVIRNFFNKRSKSYRNPSFPTPPDDPVHLLDHQCDPTELTSFSLEKLEPVFPLILYHLKIDHPFIALKLNKELYSEVLPILYRDIRVSSAQLVKLLDGIRREPSFSGVRQAGASRYFSTLRLDDIENCVDLQAEVIQHFQIPSTDDHNGDGDGPVPLPFPNLRTIHLSPHVLLSCLPAHPGSRIRQGSRRAYRNGKISVICHLIRLTSVERIILDYPPRKNPNETTEYELVHTILGGSLRLLAARPQLDFTLLDVPIETVEILLGKMILRDTHPQITFGLVSFHDEGTEGLKRDIERIWNRIGSLSERSLEEFGLAENGDSQSGRKVIFLFLDFKNGDETKGILEELKGNVPEDMQGRWDIFQSCLRFGRYHPELSE